MVGLDRQHKTPIGLHGISVAKNEIRKNKHPKRKNNDLVAAMYAMYQTGISLDKIAKAYRRTRQAVYDVFRTRGYKLRGKKLNGLTVLDGIQFTLMRGGYLRGTIPGKGRMTMQKYVWEKVNGPLPIGYVLFHKNGDKTVNTLDNLKLVKVVEMSKVFNPEHRNQYSGVGKSGK